MVKRVQTSIVSHRERLRYGFGAACIGIAALLFLLFFSRVAQGLAAPLAPTITKSSATSIVATNNTVGQAVAGELVTITVVYDVSLGETIYAASPRVVLEDGLYPTSSFPAGSEIYTGTRDFLRQNEGDGTHIIYGGALIVFPDQGAITGTSRITMTVYAVRTQRRYVANTEIANATNLKIQGVLRYCLDSNCTNPGVVYTPGNDTVGQVTAIQPQVNTTYATPTYLDSLGIGEGDGQVRLTFNAAGAFGRPAAYNIVYTATLGAGLTYAGSNGAGVGDGTVTTVGDTTYVTWNVPGSLVTPQTWQAVVTATLPNSFTVGREFTYLGAAAYETFADDVPYEGNYSNAGATQTLRPGVSVTKASLPDSGAVTMGDSVTYTVVFRQGANTLLQVPQMVDTQPLGFHYISDTLIVQGASVTSITTTQGTTEGIGANLRHYEDLTWTMSDLTFMSTSRVVTATYVALNTGLDYNGLLVHWLATDIKTLKQTISNSKTGAVLSWMPPAGSSYSAASRANASLLGVIQPYMGDNFTTQRFDAGEKEVGEDLTFVTGFRNNGYSAPSIPGIPAYELQVCDTLPTGIVFQTDSGCFNTTTSGSCPFSYTPPLAGATDEVCWTIPELSKSTNTFEFRYAVRVTDAVYPGMYGNWAFVETYSTKAGEVEGERVYADIPTALPSATCGASCYEILGLAASKTTSQIHVAPGDLITYVLAYTDTSAANSYSGLVIVDTYDSLLTLFSATPTQSSHNIGTRELTWNLGNLPNDSSGQITLVMQVSPEITDRYMLTNTMVFDSDQTAPRAWVKSTPIDVASLHVGMSGPEYTHADGDVVYTVVYSNTGSWDDAPITLTLDYGPYLTYASSSPLSPIVGTQNQVFVDTLPNNGVNKTLTINLTTNAPLPNTLEEITSTVDLASSGAPLQVDDWTITVQRPVFEFEKTGPTYASASGDINYTFYLRNTGDYTGTNLIITDTLDTNTAFKSGVGWTSYGAYAIYTVVSLPPESTATVNQLTVQISSQQDNYLNQASLSSAQTSVQTTTLRTWSPSIELAKTAYPTPAFPGRVLTYTLMYTNVGGLDIGNAVITDTLPEGFVYQPGWHTVDGPGCQTGWQFNMDGQVATWKCLLFTAESSGQLKIWGEVVDVEEGTWLENMAESDGGAAIPRRPMEEPLRTLVARPRLSVNKVGAPTHPVAPGNYVTYTLTYENYGSYPAYGVVIKDQLPTQLTFAGCDSDCTHDAGLVTWTIGEVPIATTDEVIVYATVNAGTGGQAAVNEDYTIENTTVWQRLLPVETDHGGPIETTILNPHVSVTKTATPAQVTATTQPITYTISYANDGGGTLTNLFVADVLSTKSFFHVASPGCSWSGLGAGGTVTCAIGGLTQGQSGEVQIVVLAASEGWITNTAVIDSDQTTPLETTPPTEVFYSSGGCIPPYNVSFTVSPNPKAGEVITFTASASGDAPLTYAWTFGDTQTGSGPVAYHTYAVSGTYTVKLTVSNSCYPAGVNVQKDVYAPGAPEIAWTPPSFARSAEEDSTVIEDTLTVSNVGTDNLLWSVEVMTPTEATWLKIAVSSGPPATVILPVSIAPGENVPVTLYLDPTGLGLGEHKAWLRIVSDDADDGVVLVPVTLTIVKSDYFVFLPLVLRN